MELAWSLNLFMSRFPIPTNKSSSVFHISFYYVWLPSGRLLLSTYLEKSFTYIFDFLYGSIEALLKFLSSSHLGLKTKLTEGQYKTIFSPLDLKHMPIPLNCWKNLMLMSVAKGFIQRLVFGHRNILLLYISKKLLCCIISRYCIYY